MTSNFNGTSQIQKGVNTGEIIGFAMGLLLFSVSIYAFHLSIKANRLAIKKFESEGIK
jgi:hypothetical protein